MFALPLADSRASAWVKIAASSGFAMTFLFVVISILPIVHVESRFLFAAKISGVITMANAIGLLIFKSATKRG